MSSSDLATRPTKYSKNGCKECKRRKIKCDEFIDPPPDAYPRTNNQGRQSCWQCTRLKKPCEYPLKGERVARVSRKVLLNQKKDSVPEPSAGNTPPSLSSSKALQKSSSLLGENLETPDDHTVPQRPLISIPSYHAVPAVPHRSTPDYRAGHQPLSSLDERVFHHGLNPRVDSVASPGNSPGHHSFITPGTNVAPSPGFGSSYSNVLNPQLNPPSIGDSSWPRPTQLSLPDHTKIVSNASPLNSGSDPGSSRSRSYDSADLTLIATDLNNLVNDMIFQVNDDLKATGGERFEGPSNQSFEPRSNPNISGRRSYSHIPRNIGIGMFQVSQKERIYLQEFYSGFASVILPFNAYDSIQQSYYNPMRDILFFCAFNESFMLAAILAQGARSVFLQSDSADDEFAYYKYLSRCLELLGPALGGHASKPQAKSVPNIEAVLLTVLLLTSSNAANLKQNWRPHLKGAKDILLKHTTSGKDLSSSKLLLLCKYWFVSFELLAGLGSKFGGTLQTEDELDLLLRNSDRNEIQILSNLGLVSPSGFYLIGGYHIELIPAWKDLIKLLNRKRKNPAYKLDETLEYLRLLTIFERQNSVEFVNKKALLKNSDFQDGFVPAGLLLDLISTNRKHFIISWMDTSQQLYCLAAIITILTEFFDLKHDAPQVQELVQRLMSFLEFLSEFKEAPPLIKCAVMMVQWPIVVAGINSVRREDQILALKFFDLAAKAGSGSAGYSIARMKSTWKSRETGMAYPIDDNIDVVHY